MRRTPLGRFEVVSITPMALRADSRTLKQAGSVHRLGYRSLVVEGRRSGFDQGSLPFEVVAAEAQPKTTDMQKAAEADTAPQAAKENAGSPERLQASPESRSFPTEVLPRATDTETVAEVDTAPCLAEESAAVIREEFQASPERRSFSTRWSNLRKHWRQDRISALVLVMKFGTRVLRRIAFHARRFIVFVYYYILRLLSIILINSRVIKNRILYNEVTAFIRHIFSTCRIHVYPTWKNTPNSKLYYLHAPYQFPAIAFQCIFGSSKYIYDAHDFYSHMDDHSQLPSFWTRWIVPWEGRIERWCVRHASAVVTVNQGIAGLMKDRFGRDVIVLRNAHDPRLESDSGATLRQRLGLDNEALLTVCIGQWKRDTAIVPAMQAFATLPKEHHLAFLGANFPSYDAQVADLGLEGRVHFHPAVKANEVVPFVRSADFGLLLYHAVSPSIRNCLPNGFFQPLAAGLPVVYPELPEIARIAGPLDLGLPINPLDPGSIAQAVHRLGSDDALRAAKKANVEAARHELSWERDEEVLKKLIEDLIGPPRAA